MRRFVFVAIVALVCGTVQSQTTPAAAPPAMAVPQPQMSPGEALQKAGGSLLRASTAEPPRLTTVSFFAVPDQQPKTLKKHDLVTIIVREESESKSEGTTDLKKSMDLEAKLEEYIKLSIKNLEITGGAQGPTPPSIKGSAKRDFKGEATVDRTDSLTLRVTAEVVDVKPNNTLVLQARQTIKTDDEVQTLILAGTCRVEDITPDNTVLSTQMFDKEVTKTHTGAVRDTTNRGLVTKLLDLLNPF